MKPYPFKIPPMKSFDVRKALSLLSYAIGFAERPGPFVALSVGNRSLKMIEVMATKGRREILGYWIHEVSVGETVSEQSKQKVLQEGVIAFLR
ncbi:hypothetical protein IIA15_09160, partial [candidate division TA06 bacterium]|nr:hypothetical protein [candidate division TA06 bacterium]